MKTLIPVVLLLTGCASINVELGVGYERQPKAELEASNPVAVLDISKDLSRHWVIRYRHKSSIDDGPPINQRKDDRWSELIGVFYRF